MPQFLWSEPYNKPQIVKITTADGKQKEITVGGTIGITEPRRVAVTTLAHRVALETGSHLQSGPNNGMNKNDKVSYAIRFDRVTAPGERIKFLTEGMLLQEMRSDPWLTKYGAIVVDEIHERSVDVDLLAGLLKKMLWSDFEGRGGIPLKVIVMSATADVQKLKEFFERAPEAMAVVDGALRNGASDALDHEQPVVEGTDTASTPSDFHGFSDDEPSHAATSNGSTEAILSATQSNAMSMATKKIDVKIHVVEGRQHKVDVYYLPKPPAKGYQDAILDTVQRINVMEPSGDILCFVPGRDDIDQLTAELQRAITNQMDDPRYKKAGVPLLKIHSLYGQQTMEDQNAALKPAKPGHRKVILATNVAETSITVQGVKYVIDSGQAKIKEYHPEIHINSLLRKDISKSSAEQRKGRAGRQSDGKCYRMYTPAQFEERQQDDIPEIKRSNMSSTILRMKVYGIEHPLDFEWLDKPEVVAITDALRTLVTLGALDADGRLTKLGTKLDDFPIIPEYARVLFAAAEAEGEDKCILEAIDIIAALTCGEDIFLHSKDEQEEQDWIEARQKFQSRAGDIITILNAMRQYMALDSSKQKPEKWCQENYLNFTNMKTAMSIRRDLIRLCERHDLLAEVDVPTLPHIFKTCSEGQRDSILYVFSKITHRADVQASSENGQVTTVTKCRSRAELFSKNYDEVFVERADWGMPRSTELLV